MSQVTLSDTSQDYMTHGTYVGSCEADYGKTALMYHRNAQGGELPPDTVMVQFDDPNHPNAVGWWPYPLTDWDEDQDGGCQCGGVTAREGDIIEITGRLAVRVTASRNCGECSFHGEPTTPGFWECRLTQDYPKVDPLIQEYEKLHNLTCWIDGFVYKPVKVPRNYSVEGRRDKFTTHFDPEVSWELLSVVSVTGLQAYGVALFLSGDHEWADCLAGAMTESLNGATDPLTEYEDSL